MNASQVTKLGCMVVTLADSVLAVSDRIIAIPGLSGNIVHAWPEVLLVSIIVHQFASTFMAPAVPSPVQIPQPIAKPLQGPNPNP